METPKPDMRTKEGREYTNAEQACNSMNEQLRRNKQLRENRQLRESIVAAVENIVRGYDERIAALELRILELEGKVSAPTTFGGGGPTEIFLVGSDTAESSEASQTIAVQVEGLPLSAPKPKGARKPSN